ncbi:unnamed protein product [Owenia fusiformis]|uniref:Uncharacterized protein n=1 Tax=Owenia fusiformis TaxID=6347 RepID=A0A8J1U9C2_OWEFU|nr:unnamed protein product [Owenia fusiformis]
MSKFGLLLWKNYTLQKRKVFVTLLEIGLPTFFSLILIFIRQRVITNLVTNSTTWEPYDIANLPSGLAGRLNHLAYAPNEPVIDRIMERVGKKLQLNITGLGFPSEDELVTFMKYDNGTTKQVLAAVIFNSLLQNGTFVNNISVSLRFKSTPQNADKPKFHINPFEQDSSWNTEFQFPLFQRIGPREIKKPCGGQPGYMREGFLPLQLAVNEEIIQEISGNTPDIKVEMRRFPYPPYNDDPFVLVLQQQFPLILMLSFVFIALNIVKDVVYEKERKLKESMKMMGMNNWLHWTAWFVKYFVFQLITVGIMTIFYCIKIPPKGSVIGYSAWSVIFMFLIIYSMTTIMFSFAISVFFSKANSAAAAGGILFFISYIPYFFLQPRYDTLPLYVKLIFCLIPNVAMAFGGQVIGMFEGTGSGVQWSNLSVGVSVDDSFTMLQVWLMLLIDCVLYGAIAWYVEAVFPGEYGVPQRWYFPFTKTYWCGGKSMMNEESSEYTPLLHGTEQNSAYFEDNPVGIKAGIQIRNLRKVFKEGTKKEHVAVAGMTLDMFEGQITALLGHNGAGKTTTMSMLTGFIPVTSGMANVSDYDITTNIDGVRSSLGICPQHDVLFDTLTVDEHLRFFAKLKGCKASALDQEVNTMIQSIGLTSKQHELAKTLSGGQKRKLSMGIALIAGSKVVILDEPTSGMDPDARRHAWDILQSHRAGRTLLLTTHFMDEADHLGDRIAIMANGVVQCCGSSLFLKNKYGAGYHMIIVKQPHCDVTKLTNIINRYVPMARLESNISAEVSYILPREESHKFEELFTDLETNKEALGIASYGASVTTMEEVFLRVGEQTDDDLKERLQDNGIKNQYGSLPKDVAINSGGSSSSASSQNGGTGLTFDVTRFNYGPVLLSQQVVAMFKKRMLHTFRNQLITLTQLLIPLFFTISALIVIKTLPGPTDSPSLVLSLDKFSRNYVSLGTSPSSSFTMNNVSRIYESQFLQKKTSTRVVNVDTLTPYKYIDNNVEMFLEDEGIKSIATYNDEYLIAAQFHTEHTMKDNKTINKDIIRTEFNDQGYHTPAIALQYVSNAMLKYFTNSNYTIEATNAPLPRTLKERLGENSNMKVATTGFTVSFNVLFGFAFLASSFVLFLIKERQTKAKHIQFVSGVHSVSFWSATFLWDFLNYLIPVILLLVTFVAFKMDAYTSGTNLGSILLLFVVYGWAMLPMMYLMSFIFDVPSTGFVWITMWNILSGIATMLAVNILSIPQLQTEDLSKTLDWIFITLLPNYGLAQGLLDFYMNYEYITICSDPIVKQLCGIGATLPCCKGNCGDNCLDFQYNYLSWERNGIGRMLVFMGLQGFLYFAILFLMESQLLRELWYSIKSAVDQRQTNGQEHYQTDNNAFITEDSDVKNERELMASTPINYLVEKYSLVIKNLTKYYGSLRAVNQLNVGISQGDCFGLLGLNGAGKTSTFKMMTGDETVSGGTAYLGGYDIRHSIGKVQQMLGYCPQFDALIDQLTGRETLQMYARLRGIPESEIPRVVNGLISSLLLEQHADKLSGEYSGGNKRKLSTAISLVGNPPILFLDEPTTGMDPVARRLLWDTLSRVRASGRTLVLTSHSMEECEALCTRIGIMVNGVFKCLGSTQHLKNKFGEGYTLIAKIGYPKDGGLPNTQPLMGFIEGTFPGCILKDMHQGMLHYHITNTDLSWAAIFGTMERAKVQFNIEDYSVSQTTLEQVFINFARAQVPPQDMKSGCCKGCCIFFNYCCCSCHSDHEELVSEEIA